MPVAHRVDQWDGAGAAVRLATGSVRV